MRLYAGTSGWNYDEWKGPFYPEDLPKKERLRYYAECLDAVEVNNTFYRVPKSNVVEGWAAQATGDFVFVLKVSRRITHIARLEERSHETMDYMWRAATLLGERRGPMLFQLPPNFRADVDRLRAFLERLPEGCRAAFEFRHDSWRNDSVYDALRAAGAAVCHADTDRDRTPEIVPTADWGYFRLRRETYDASELKAWAERMRAQPWHEVFAFFKHEDEGAAPRLAHEFRGLFAERS